MFTSWKYVSRDGKVLYKMWIEVIMEVTFIFFCISAFPIMNFAQKYPKELFPSFISWRICFAKCLRICPLSFWESRLFLGSWHICLLMLCKVSHFSYVETQKQHIRGLAEGMKWHVCSQLSFVRLYLCWAALFQSLVPLSSKSKSCFGYSDLEKRTSDPLLPDDLAATLTQMPWLSGWRIKVCSLMSLILSLWEFSSLCLAAVCLCPL